MSKALRQYTASHVASESSPGATAPPGCGACAVSAEEAPDSSRLAQLQAFITTYGAPDAAGLAQLSRSLRLPVAAIRGLITFYADLHADPAAARVCSGTSCMLAGGASPRGSAPGADGARDVYCLGYCDRSPAVLLADERIALGCPADAGPAEWRALAQDRPAAASIRCVSRESIVTARLRDGDHCDLARARAAGAYAALPIALSHPPAWVVEQIVHSGLRGRGGAGFPTGTKWRLCAEQSSAVKYVVANGDEGDPGSFIDRELMERDPHAILEGLMLAAYGVGATRGFVYVRSEYPRAYRVLCHAVEQARGAGLLGPAGGGRPAFDVSVVRGHGSYVCGEETALLNAIEGQRGEVRLRPPYPAVAGLWGCPTIVDNVETLVNAPWIVGRGAEAYRALGSPDCPGTKALCLNHGLARPGIVEVEFGIPLREVIERLGGGPAGELEIEAVLIGGPMGSIVRSADWDVPVSIEAMRRRGINLGHGGIVALPADTDYAALLAHMLAFMRDESCGKCVPCRVGTKLAAQALEGSRGANIPAELPRILDLMSSASLCAFGRDTPGPVRQLLAYFGERIARGRRP